MLTTEKLQVALADLPTLPANDVLEYHRKAALSEIWTVVGGQANTSVNFSRPVFHVQTRALTSVNMYNPLEILLSVNPTDVRVGNVMYTDSSGDRIARVSLTTDKAFPDESYLYLIVDFRLLSFGKMTITDNSAFADFANDDAYGLAIRPVMVAVEAGDPIAIVVTHEKDMSMLVSRDDIVDTINMALIDLVKLSVQFDALNSIRDGTYSQVRSDNLMERSRILNRVRNVFVN